MEKDAVATMKAKLRKQKGLRTDQKKVEIKLQEFRGMKKPTPPQTSKPGDITKRMNDLVDKIRLLNVQMKKRIGK